jgi:hypothetical protein
MGSDIFKRMETARSEEIVSTSTRTRMGHLTYYRTESKRACAYVLPFTLHDLHFCNTDETHLTPQIRRQIIGHQQSTTSSQMLFTGNPLGDLSVTIRRIRESLPGLLARLEPAGNGDNHLGLEEGEDRGSGESGGVTGVANDRYGQIERLVRCSSLLYLLNFSQLTLFFLHRQTECYPHWLPCKT